jgi:hypothetical protein
MAFPKVLVSTVKQRGMPMTLLKKSYGERQWSATDKNRRLL